MKIYEVCKESALQITENNTNDIPGTSTSTPNEFKILLDDNGEPIIEKQLYNTIRERFLPYDEVFITYFGRVCLMTIFSVFLYLMLSTVQTSGLSSVVLIINAMATTSLPLIVHLIWKTCSDEQKAANTLALKSKLEKVLVVHGYNKVTGEIIVEVTKREIQGEGESEGSESGGSENDATTQGENVRSEPSGLESNATTQGENVRSEPGGLESGATTQGERSEPGGLESDATTQENDSENVPLILVHRDSLSAGSRTNEEGQSDESGNEATSPI